MSQKKTVFERLEDTMVELQKNLEIKLGKLQSAIERVQEEIPKALGTLKEEIPRSMGQNLMSFTDVIGAKIEEIEDAIKKIGGTGGPSGDTVSSNVIQNDLSSIKQSILTLETTLKNLKSGTPITVSSTPSTPAPAPPTPTTPTYAHALTPIPSTPSYTPPKTPPPAPAPTVTLRPPSPPVTASKPASATSQPMADVFKLLDSIKEKAKSGVTAVQLANEMEQTRDAIVKIFRWHPALYELATFARRLKKYAEGAPLENETRTSLLEKIEEWKNRINT